MRILIVDDDRPLAELLGRALRGDDVEVRLAHTLEEGLAAYRKHGADLLLLDLDLEPIPGPRPDSRRTLGGAVFLELLRRERPLCPVLVLSAAADTATRVYCLDLGADDCLRKPFSLSEVRARVRALLRRQRHLEAAVTAAGLDSIRRAAQLTGGGLTLDRLARTADLAGTPLTLTHREFALLEQLLLAGGEVVSRAWLREALGATGSEANTIDVHMVALRRKLAVSPAAPRIETVRGSGYRLIPGSAEPLPVLVSPPLRTMPWEGKR